jgi:uncharacterized membrane protein YsdA (DUF1294 family)
MPQNSRNKTKKTTKVPGQRDERGEMLPASTPARRGQQARPDSLPAFALGGGDWTLAALMMALPFTAWHELAPSGFFWVAPGWVVFISIVTWLMVRTDKVRAQRNGPRTPESLLHGFEILGGSPGSWLAQKRFRHKTLKLRYRLVFWLVVLLQQTLAVLMLRSVWKPWLESFSI